MSGRQIAYDSNFLFKIDREQRTQYRHENSLYLERFAFKTNYRQKSTYNRKIKLYLFNVFV